MSKLLRLFLAISFTTCAAFAQLEDLEFEGSNSLRYEEGDEVSVGLAGRDYPHNTIARHFIENQLRMDLYGYGLRVGGRLLYFKPSDGDIEQYGLADTIGFDKRYIEAKIDPITLRAGDFSELWGHGLVLSLFENRALYFDSELDGVRGMMQFGPLKLIGLSGTTPDGFLVRKTEVTAGRIEAGQEGTNLGFSYARNDSGHYSEANTAGVDWNFSKGAFNVYGEHAWKDTYLTRDKDVYSWAWFYGLTVTKWNWSLLLEYNNYDYGLYSPIQNPPATYREVGPRLLSGREPHYLSIGDEVGYQLELSGSATENIYATLHYNLSSHHRDGQAGIPRPTLQQEDAPFWEMFANAEWYLPGDRTAFLELGANEEAGVTWQERKWVQIKYTTPVRDNGELEFEVEQLLVTEFLPEEDRDLHDQLYSIGWTPDPKFSIVFIYQLSDDEELKKREGENWPSVESAVTFGGGRHRMILFYGRERGGLKCSNGVCRPVQAFSGFRLTLETSL